MVRQKRWIQNAGLKQGALKSQMRSTYGAKAFTNRGTIKVDFLEKAAARGGKLGKRANLAMTLRELNKGRKR